MNAPKPTRAKLARAIHSERVRELDVFMRENCRVPTTRRRRILTNHSGVGDSWKVLAARTCPQWLCGSGLQLVLHALRVVRSFARYVAAGGILSVMEISQQSTSASVAISILLTIP
jgi:hypothetical protein